MTDERTDRHIETRDGIQVYVYDDGKIQRVDNGQMLRGADSTIIRTPEQARELLKIRREKALRSKMRGLARGAGIDIDENAVEEELVSKASDALEAYTAHLGKVFLETKNIRGMGEVFPKLTDVFHVQEPEQTKPAEPTLTEAITGLIGAIQDAVRKQGEVIDGEARDIHVLTDTHPKP